MPRRRNRARSGRGRRRQRQQVVEIITLDSGTGATQSVTRANLTSIPANRAFRISHVNCSLIGGIYFTAATSTAAAIGGIWPTWAQVRIYGSEGGAAIATSGPVMLSPTVPRTVTVRNPRQSDWVRSDAPGTQVVLAVDHGCIRTSQPSNTHNSGVMRVYIDIGVEEGSESCPTYNHIGADDDEGLVIV